MLICLFVIIFLRNAWIAEDAFITFRVVENFVNGYGPVFNVGERVQAYTHTLWFFLLSGIYFLESLILNRAIFGGLYYLSLGISLIICVLSLWLLAFHVVEDKVMAAMSIGFLCLSKSFIDYSSSGLENSATYFLLVAFVACWYKEFESPRFKHIMLAVITALAVLNRVDTLLFYIPAIVIWFIQNSDKKSMLWPFVLGFLPLFLWEIFSVIYYGQLIPNTAYAKINTGIPLGLKLYQGIVYFISAIESHPYTLFVIVIGSLIPVIHKNSKILPFSFGIILYIGYILFIGGDFMAGRFLAAPFFLSVINLASLKYENDGIPRALAIVVLLFGFIAEKPSPLYTDSSYGSSIPKDVDETLYPSGIVDEKAFLYKFTGLLRVNREFEPLASRYEQGRWKETAQGKIILVRNSIGQVGYERGPDYHFLDSIGIPDAFIAQLPMVKDDLSDWRVGHYNRQIPDGYYESLVTGQNQIEDPSLHEFYDKIRLITTGNIFTFDRFKVIWKLNTGQYNHLIEEYLANLES